MAYLFLGNLCFSSDERCVTLQLRDCAIITWRGAGLVGKLEGGHRRKCVKREGGLDIKF